jgi:hypothetical protein
MPDGPGRRVVLLQLGDLVFVGFSLQRGKIGAR